MQHEGAENATQMIDRVPSYAGIIGPSKFRRDKLFKSGYAKNNIFTYPGGKRDSGAEDAIIVATHMILAAADEGVDSCWTISLTREGWLKHSICRKMKKC